MNTNDNPAPMSAGNRGEWVLADRHALLNVESMLRYAIGDGPSSRTLIESSRQRVLEILASPAPPPSNGCAVIVPRDVMEAAERMAVPLADGRPTLTDKLDEQCSQRILSFLRSLAAAPQPSAPSAPEAGGDRLAAACRGCAKPYSAFPLDMTIPDEQWLAINDGESGGLLCAACIVERLAKLKHAIAVRAYLETATTTKAGGIDEAMVERALDVFWDRPGRCVELDRERMRAALEAAGLGGVGGDGIPDVFSAYRTWPQDIRAKLSLHDLRRMAGWAPRTSVADWRIDTSAGGPILVYQDCSVIEGEQARYILGLIHADTNRAAQPSESEAGGQEGECPHEAWEENGGARRCSDCREYLGHAPAPAEGGR
jgi:hypothetical protein